MAAVSEQWSLKAGGLLLQVVSNTGLTVFADDKCGSMGDFCIWSDKK